MQYTLHCTWGSGEVLANHMFANIKMANDFLRVPTNMNWGAVIATGCVAAILAIMAREELISSSTDMVAKFPGNIMDLRDIKAPRLSGMPLRLFAIATRMPVIGALVCKFLKRNNNFVEVRELATIVPDMPLYYPLHFPTQDEMEQHKKQATGFSIDKLRFDALDGDAFNFKRWTIQDYTDRYKSGQTTPLDVARAVLAAIDDSNARSVPLRAVLHCKKHEVLEEAKASTARYAAGTPSGVLDGVPVLIKDEVRQIYTVLFSSAYDIVFASSLSRVMIDPRQGI
jgi:hypothetical protein